MPSRISPVFATVFLIVLCACSEQDAPVMETAEPLASDTNAVSAYVAAVAHPGRTDADRPRDADRRPAEVMEFFGIHSINLPALGFPTVPDQPLGWVDVQLSPNGARLELHSLDPEHPQQGEIFDLEW